MKTTKRFLQWWLLICLCGLGLFFFGYNGGISYVYKADFTKITVIIFALFIYGSILVGIRTKNGNGGVGMAKFFSRIMPMLGMFGTVIGFIWMLKVSPFESTGDVNAMKCVFTDMFRGMSTALVTTAAGLAGSLILKVQIFNYEYRKEYTKQA